MHIDVNYFSMGVAKFYTVKKSWSRFILTKGGPNSFPAHLAKKKI